MPRWTAAAFHATLYGDAPARLDAVSASSATSAATSGARSPAPLPREAPTGLPARDGRGVEGEMLAGHHAHDDGGLDYLLYRPSQAGPEPRPLIVMLHGCGQDARDFAAGTAMNAAAEARGCYVVYPEQAARANAQRCWSWFQRSHQQRDRGEPAVIAGIVRDVMSRHAVDPARVYVAGLSAGGAMAAIVGATHPDLFAAVGVHSGLPAGAASNLPAAISAMRNGAPAPASSLPLPTIVFHGDADSTVHPRNGEQVALASARSLAGSPAPTGRLIRRRGQRPTTRHLHRSDTGQVLVEHWVVHGAPHVWSGGMQSGSFTDPQGPNASAEMLRFFLQHPRTTRH